MKKRHGAAKRESKLLTSLTGHNGHRPHRSWMAWSRFDPRTDICSNAGDGTAIHLSAPGAVRHDVAHQVAHVVLQISDDVLDDVSNRDHAHDLARVQHW